MKHTRKRKSERERERGRLEVGIPHSSLQIPTFGFGCWLVGWLVGFLWHINLCRLYNAKSIFIQIVLFQTIQFNRSVQFKCNYSLIVKNLSISSYSL